jgi:hypothetical protein
MPVGVATSSAVFWQPVRARAALAPSANKRENLDILEIGLEKEKSEFQGVTCYLAAASSRR